MVCILYPTKWHIKRRKTTARNDEKQQQTNGTHTRKFGNKQEIILGDSKYEVLLMPMPLAMNEWIIATINMIPFQRHRQQHFFLCLCFLRNFHRLHTPALYASI